MQWFLSASLLCENPLRPASTEFGSGTFSHPQMPCTLLRNVQNLVAAQFYAVHKSYHCRANRPLSILPTPARPVDDQCHETDMRQRWLVSSLLQGLGELAI